jgi:hypothetical protein
VTAGPCPALRIVLYAALLAPLPALAEGSRCGSNRDCGQDRYCDAGQCRPLGPRLFAPFYYRSADKQFWAIWPFYWRHEPGPEGEMRVVFPFYWHFDDRELKVKHTVVPPLQWRSTVGEANTRVWPLFFYTDYAKRGRSLTLLPLLYWSHVDGESLAIFPLGFWRGNDRTGYRQGLVLPYYFRRARGDERTDAVVPLMFARSSPDAAFEFMLPLDFYWRDQQRRSLLLFPLVFHRSGVRERVLFTLVPPMLYTRSDPPPPSNLGRPRGVEERFFTLFPVLWYQRSGGYSFTLLPPFFHRGRPDGYHSGLFPVIWTGREGDERYAVTFPLYWHFSSKKSGFTLAALFYHRRSEQGSASGVVPVAFWGEDRERGTSYRLVLPLFYRGTEAHGHRTTTVLLPLLWWSKDEDAGLRRQVLALNYYHRRDRARSIDTLFPLFLRWHNADVGGTTWVVPPLVWYDDPEQRTTLFFPFYVGFSDKRAHAAGGLLLGVFYWSGAPDSSTHVLFPLLYSSRHGPQRSFVLFPLVWHVSDERRGTRTTLIGPVYSVRDREGLSWGLAPLLWAGDSDGVSHLIVPPVFAHIRSEREGWNAWVLVPFYAVGTRTGWSAGLVPLAFFGASADKKSGHVVIPPLLFAHNKAPRAESWWLGPWVDSQSFDADRAEHRFRMFFPLYFQTREPTPQGSRDTMTVLPIFHWRSDARRELIVTPVGGLYHDRATPSETGLWGPIAYRRSPTVSGRAFVPFWIQVDDARDRSRTRVLFPFWVGFRAPGRRADVVFPLFWYFHETDETDLTVFPFYFGVRRADRTDDVDVVFPLFWSWRSPKRSFRVVPPVYWRNGPDGGGAFGLIPIVFSATSRERSYFVFFPLVWHFDDKVEHRVRRYYGPVYNHQDARGWSFGVFPLLFLNNHQDSSFSVVFPVFWNFADHKADTRTTFATLFFWRRKVAWTTVGLAPIFWTTWNRAGGFAMTLLPLFHYRSRVGEFRLWTLPFGYSHDDLVRQGWFIPYYGRRDPTRAIDWAMPLFLRWHERALGRTTWVVPPLLLYSKSDPYGRTDTALLLFWHVARIDSRNTVLFPLYWDFHSYEERRTTVVFPVFWRFANRATHKTTWLLLPLLLGGTSHPWGNDVVWFPLLWRAQERTDGYTVFFPLYWDFWQGKTRTTVVFPLGFRAERATTRTWLVLNTLVRLYKQTDGYQVMFLPLFEWARERPEDLRWEVVLGLLGYERVGGDRYLKVLWIPVHMQSPAPGRMAWFDSGRRPTGWIRE